MARVNYTAKTRKKAFELFHKLGSFYAVSKEKGMPTVQTLINWSKEDHWEEKLEAIRKGIRNELKEEGLIETVSSDIDELKILKRLEEIAIKQINEKGLRPRIWKDVIATFDFTTKTRRLIRGEPTGREEHKIIWEIKDFSEEEIKGEGDKGRV